MSQPSRSVHDLSAVIGWTFLAAGALALGWWLVQFWGGSSDSADRLLIPLAAGWLLIRRLSHETTCPDRPTAWGLALIVPGAALAPAAWFVYCLMGPIPTLLWTLALAWIAAAAGFILIQGGPATLRACVFPLLLLLFSLPLPMPIETALQTRLQQATVSIAHAVLSFCGIAVQRHGFVLSLPSGDLGVVDACTGIRSVTSIVAIAALVAYWRGFGPLRGTVFTLLALPIIVLANSVRVILSGVLQEQFGAAVNQGTPHTLIGIVTLLLGLSAVLALSQLLRPRPKAGDDHNGTTAQRSEGVVPSCRRGERSGLVNSAANAFLGMAIAGSAVAYWWANPTIGGEEPPAPIENIATRLGPWVGRDEPIDPGVRAELAYDSAVHRSYVNGSGQRVEAWVLCWHSPHALKNYAHHPDICWPRRGWNRVGLGRRPLQLPPPGELSMTVRHYERDGQQQFLGYWTQDGAHVWTDEDERRGRGEGPFGARTLDRLLHRSQSARMPRLVVLVGADLWDTNGYAEAKVEEFAAELAKELYRVCPWALPTK